MRHESHPRKLENGNRIAVVGGGPAGSFFSYFLLDMAKAVGVEIALDIYEPRDFTLEGPAGCNMCGGIVSESLVQALATEGITLGPEIVQRTIDSYFLHMDVGGVTITTPRREMRIASVHRGGGPRGSKSKRIGGLDGHLLRLAIEQGACWRRSRVSKVEFSGGLPRVTAEPGETNTYDLVVGAVGVNSSALQLFEGAGIPYKSPAVAKTYISEFLFSRSMIDREMGNAMHVFLLDIPGLEFAALVPKGDYVTLVVLGNTDKKLIDEFVSSRVVREALPPNWAPPTDFCHCSPKIAVGTAWPPFADRVVFVGDCGTSRLYKDGIGAAYRTAKAAAKTIIFHGYSESDFRRHFWPVCRNIDNDNRIGKFVFAVTRQIQQRSFARRGLWRMVSQEQRASGTTPRMSSVLWDTFTGSAPYSSVLLRTLHPMFLTRFLWALSVANLRPKREAV